LFSRNANQDTLFHFLQMQLLQAHGRRFSGCGSLEEPVAHAQRWLKNASRRCPTGFHNGGSFKTTHIIRRLVSQILLAADAAARIV